MQKENSLGRVVQEKKWIFCNFILGVKKDKRDKTGKDVGQLPQSYSVVFTIFPNSLAWEIIFRTTDYFCVPGALEGHLSALRHVGHPDHPPAKAHGGSQLAENEPKAKIFCRGISPWV